MVMRSIAYALFLAATALAQSAPHNEPLAELSYHPTGKLIYMSVEINDAGPFMFCFDSGAPNSIVDTAVAQKLSLQVVSNGNIRGAGKGDIAAADAGEVQFTFAGLTTRVPHAKIVDLSKVPLPERIDGLLGAEFLEKYVVRIDPVQHKIAFYDPESFHYADKGKPLALELTNSRLYVHAGLAVRPGELVDRKLRVDTGSEDAVDDDTIRKSSQTQKTTLGNGLGASYEESPVSMIRSHSDPSFSTVCGAQRAGCRSLEWRYCAALL
jgi:aspartyl protease